MTSPLRRHATTEAPDSAQGGRPTPHDVEDDWVARARGGDVGAFERIYRAYADRLVVLARRYVSSADAAEDIVHEVFLRMWQARAKLEVRHGLSAYLSAAVRHGAFRTERRRRAEQTWYGDHVAESAPAVSRPVPTPAADVERRELEDALSAAIAQLPPRAQDIARMRWHDGMCRADIAAALGITVGTVHTQLKLAVRATCRRLQRFRP
jgi:RNA polymerase sigma factor (sigma-70 family)